MKPTVFIQVNNEVLRWAREALAISRAKASESSGISIKRLEQLEEGEKQPLLEELKSLSNIYKRTIATLLLQNPPREKPLPKDRRTVNSEELGNFHEKTILAIRKARAIVQSLIELKENQGQHLNKFEFKATLNDSAYEIATKLRRRLNLDEITQTDNNIAFESYLEIVESLGVCILQLSLTQDNLRGFSIVDERMPVIGIKRGGEPVTAKTFTLFHELGHIVLNEGGICDISFDPNAQQIEKWCNAFAAELLIPSERLLKIGLVERQIKTGEKSWSNKDLIEIGSYFHVGPLSILRRLLEHNLTTKAFYQKKHEVWNKPSFGRSKNPEGRNIAKETIKERGKNYVRLAFKAYDQNKIDIKDLSDFLGIKLSYIPKTRQLLNP